MTKYGHKSGFIAISRLRAWIVDKVYFKEEYPNSYISHTYITLLTLIIACKAKQANCKFIKYLKVASFDKLSKCDLIELV